MCVLPVFMLGSQYTKVFSLKLEAPLGITLLGMGLSDLFQHQEEEGRLRTVQVVLPQSVRYKAMLLQDQSKSIKYALSCAQHIASYQSQDNPISVPIVALPESATRHQDFSAINQL